MVFTCGGDARLPRRRGGRAHTTTGWPWRSPLRRSAPRARPPSTTPARRPSPTPSSSPCSSRFARERGQAVPGRVHGRGQDHGGPGARPPARDGASRTSTSASKRASGGPSPRSSRSRANPISGSRSARCLSELLPDRQVIVATGGGTFAEPDNRALMLADGAVAWLDVPLRPSDGARARRRPPAARRRSRPDGTAVQPPPAGLREAHVRIDATRPRARGRRTPARVDSGTLRCDTWSSATSTRTSKRSMRPWRRPATRRRSWCSATWSATAPIPNAVIDRIRALPSATLIRGNHDKVGAGHRHGRQLQSPRAPRHRVDGRRAVTPERRDWLAALPRVRSTSTNCVEICHGAPFDEDVYIFDDLDVAARVRGDARPLCLFGHTHVPAAFRFDTAAADRAAARGTRSASRSTATPRYLVNCGAVGQPRDGDPRAAFGVLDTESTHADRRACDLRRRRGAGEDHRRRPARGARAALAIGDAESRAARHRCTDVPSSRTSWSSERRCAVLVRRLTCACAAVVASATHRRRPRRASRESSR